MAYVVAILCVVGFGLFIRHMIRKSKDDGSSAIAQKPAPKFPPEEKL